MRREKLPGARPTCSAPQPDCACLGLGGSIGPGEAGLGLQPAECFFGTRAELHRGRFLWQRALLGLKGRKRRPQLGWSSLWGVGDQDRVLRTPGPCPPTPVMLLEPRTIGKLEAPLGHPGPGGALGTDVRAEGFGKRKAWNNAPGGPSHRQGQRRSCVAGSQRSALEVLTQLPSYPAFLSIWCPLPMPALPQINKYLLGQWPRWGASPSPQRGTNFLTHQTHSSLLPCSGYGARSLRFRKGSTALPKI